jgi:hypothetical protein
MPFVAIKMDRLEKQPTDLRQKAYYFGDRTPGRKAELLPPELAKEFPPNDVAALRRNHLVG